VPADAPRTDAPDARLRWGMGDAVLGTIGAPLVSVVVYSIALSLSHTSAEDSDAIPLWAVALLQIPLWATLLAVAWRATMRKGRRSFRDDFGLRFERKDLWIGLAAGFLAQIAIAAVIALLEAVGLDLSSVGEVAEEFADRADSVPSTIVFVLIVVVFAPVVEEIFYRGLWQRSAQRRLGRAAGLVLTAVVFGIIHLQPADILPLIGFGLVAGWLADRYDRLGPAVWAHVAFNLTAAVTLLSLG
jgi:membrane protease YdiL (CAAX protease family)